VIVSFGKGREQIAKMDRVFEFLNFFCGFFATIDKNEKEER